MQCVICGSEVWRPNSRRYRSPLNDTDYCLQSCSRCDSEYWTPLNMVPHLYRDEVFDFYSTFHQGQGAVQPWHRLFLQQPPPTGRLLDIGCGDGAFLTRARKLGFEPWGLDLDTRSVQSAQAHLDRVFDLPLADFSTRAISEGVRFDVVSCFEVLEHQDDPLAFLTLARGLLARGGRIVGSVPNRDRLFPEHDRGLESGDLPPHHFFWFSEKSLREILERAGFTSVRIVRPRAMVSEVSAFVEALLLGRLSRELKRRVRAYTGGRAGATAPARSIGLIPPLRNSVLSALRRIRDVVFLPAGALIAVPYNRRGAHLYFEAKCDSGA
jgi:SAM-dependent methyltransferase